MIESRSKKAAVLSLAGVMVILALAALLASLGQPTSPAAAQTPDYGTSITSAAADISTPTTATVATVVYTGVSNRKHVISGLAWSYAGGTPAGGNLKIEDGTATVFSMDITAAGPGSVAFPKPKKGAAVSTNMTVTLAAGGASVIGKLNVLNHWTEE